MSYQTARDKIATVLNGLGYHEATFDALDTPSRTQTHKGFNIRIGEWNVEPMLHNKVHSQPQFEIHLWWVGKQNQQKDYDNAATALEGIMAKLLNPTNYASGDRIHRWEVGNIEYDAEQGVYEVIVSVEVEYDITLT